jgi:hypothetical protein
MLCHAFAETGSASRPPARAGQGHMKQVRQIAQSTNRSVRQSISPSAPVSPGGVAGVDLEPERMASGEPADLLLLLPPTIRRVRRWRCAERVGW